MRDTFVRAGLKFIPKNEVEVGIRFQERQVLKIRALRDTLSHSFQL